jgi:hypothetical protein
MDYKNLFEYHDGLIFWIESPAFNIPARSLAGTLRDDGYIGVYLNKKYIFAHRIVWEMFNSPLLDTEYIDHINGQRADNRIENLRKCTLQQNAYNRGKQSNNKSGYKGVSWHKQKCKWVAQIKIDGRNKFLGFFTDPEEAYKRYCEVAKECYGEFASF